MTAFPAFDELLKRLRAQPDLEALRDTPIAVIVDHKGPFRRVLANGFTLGQLLKELADLTDISRNATR